MLKPIEFTKYVDLAVIVIDMQHDFVDEGAPIECHGARNTVPLINVLVNAAHLYSVPVIFTKEVHRAQKVDFGLELEGGEPLHCLEGTLGCELVPGLGRLGNDYLILKRRYSAFFGTDLDLLLRGLSVNTVILTGAATDVCVLYTALDAQQYGYSVFVAPECVAGTTPDRHKAALENIGYILGRVMPFDDVLWLITGKKRT